MKNPLSFVGTRSVLYGAHCFFIHPWFVAEAWRRLYGFPTDPRLWAAFFVHDLGYVSAPNMDGAEGEKHCEWGAVCMTVVFDQFDASQKAGKGSSRYLLDVTPNDGKPGRVGRVLGTWGQFCLFHSRFYAKKAGRPFSRLCVADKLAVALEPWWLYLPRVWASGELWEYMARASGEPGSKYDGEPETGKYASMNVISRDPSLSRYQKVRHWHRRMTDYLRQWVNEHKDGRTDTWTPEQ